MNCFRYFAVLIIGIILIAGDPVLNAQVPTADIVGTVTDAAGALVPEATVVVKNVGTSTTRTLKTNESGEYTATLLQVGTYSVTVQAPGFSTFSNRNLVLAAGDRVRIDAKLQPGQATETVNVTASDTAILQTDRSTTGETISTKAVQDLPVNGRNFIRLAQLVPGANEGSPNALTSGTRPDDRRQTSTVSVNGQADVTNNNLIDGMDNNERISGLFGVKPSIDAIQEVRVDTNLYSADIGRTAGAVINIITKSGTNGFHGSAYEFVRNDVFDAKNYFNVPQTGNSFAGKKPKFRQNQFGGSLGGPIRKDKTFFFVDDEELRIVQGLTSASTVPTPCELGLATCNGVTQLGNFSDLLPATIIYDPTTAIPFPNNVIPVNRINSVSKNYANLLPGVSGCNSGTSCQFVYNPIRTQNARTLDARIDQHFTANDYLYARYSLNDTLTFTPGALPAVNGIEPGGNPTGQSFPGPATERQQEVAISFLHIFTPAIALQVSTSFLRTASQSLPLNYGKNPNTVFGGPPVNVSPFTSSLATVNLAGYQTLGDPGFVPLLQFDNTFGYNAQLSITRGTHDIKIGGGLYRRHVTKNQSQAPTGSFSFDSVLTSSKEGGAGSTGGNTFASFLLGYPTQQSRVLTLVSPSYRTWEPSIYVQDNWRVTQHLTFNLGLRYDLFTPYTETKNQISNFDPTVPEVLNTKTVVVAGTSLGGSTAGVKTDYYGIAPRFGFAFTLDPKTVVRGGFGISFFPGNYSSPASLKNEPFTSTFVLNTAKGQGPGFTPPVFGAALPAPTSTPICLAPSCGFVPSPTLGTTTSVPAAQAFNFRNNYVYQFNLLVERQVGANAFTIGYVGVIGRHLARVIPNINLPLPPLGPGGCGVTTAITLPNPCQPFYAQLPLTTGIQFLDTGGISNYSSLQTTFQRRFVRGLTFSANYTFAGALSNTGNTGQPCSAGCGLVLNNISRYDYGYSDLYIRHRATMTLNYQLPYGSYLHGFKGVLAKGWQFNALVAANTGLPFTVTNNIPQINNGVTADRPDRVAGVGGFGVQPNRTLQRFFDITAFRKQPFGTAGNEARNAVFGPGAQRVDLSVFKDFTLREPVHLQFRVETFNTLNTPSFAAPGSAITAFDVNGIPTASGNFGVITATANSYTPRDLQMAARLTF